MALAACDSGFGGALHENAAPETELSVRSSDLREDLGGRRLVSTVTLAWSGTDPDGVVAGFDVRAYAVGAAFPTPGPEEGWRRTTRRDSTILLPIPLGQETADVAVEVRAVDDAGAVDPTPARTIFPILNSPPSSRLTSAEAPADTTWPVVSFAFSAADPDGDPNLAAVEVALNDSAAFVRLPPDATFITLVAADPAATGTTSADVYLGRGFSNAGLSLPGLRLDAENTVYLRSVDRAGAVSPTVAYPDRDGGGVFYVRRVTSTVLLVNDVRTNADAQVLAVAREALAKHGTTTYDEWDLSETPQLATDPRFSDGLPTTADPTLRQTMTLWSHIYWASNAVTNSAVGNNLPRVATVLDRFFDRGGRILVHTPVTLPQGADGGTDNAAIDLLPLSGLIEFPPGIRALRADGGATVRPGAEVPGTGRALPPLRTTRLLTSALPYVTGPDDIPLYRLSFYQNNNPADPWQGSEVLASIRSDRRAALFALPLFVGSSPLFEPAAGSTAGVVDALSLLLDGLEFPAGARRLASR